MSKNVKQNIKSLSARIFGPYLSFVKGTSSRLKKSNNSRDRTSCKKWKLKKFPWKKTLFKKYYHLKKLLRTLCSDKKFQDNHQHLELDHSMWTTTAKTIIISVKGTPIFFKALDLFL